MSKKRLIYSSVTLAILALAGTAQAQDQATPASSDGTQLEKVYVTGSSIRQYATKEALPVTVIKAEEFSKEGYTTLADVLDALSFGQSAVPSSAGAGTIINLRGLGLNRTLVLLDGQRMANEPTEDGYVNIDLIPISAIDHIEILRDGASSTYGSDAIAGVINFITKKTLKGGVIGAQVVHPKMGGGANEKRGTLSLGFGDLETQGWNAWFTADVHTRSELLTSSRPYLTSASYLNGLGLSANNGSAGYSYPANIVSPSVTINGTKYSTYNPYTNCLAPYSTAVSTGGCANNNTALYGVAMPANEQGSTFSKFTYKLSDTNTLTTSLLYSEEYILVPKSAPSTSTGFSQVPGGAASQVMTITPASPYYPGGSGGVPAIKGITNQTLTLEWNGDALGPAVAKDKQINTRLLVSDEGTWLGWDYKANLDLSGEDRNNHAVQGYINGPGLDAAVLAGTINPFGAQNAAGQAALNGLSEDGALLRDTRDDHEGINFSATHEIARPTGGEPITLAVGGDYRYDSMFDLSPANNINIPYNSRKPYYVSASRHVVGAFAELNLPITKRLNIDISVRDDQYSTEGTVVNSGINPKASLRFEVSKQVMLRGSVSTGFHAPTLIDQYGYYLPGANTTTSSKYDDPLLCPGGTPGVGGTGKLIANSPETAAVACNAKQPVQTGSNINLQPEKSKSGTFGVVYEPYHDLSTSLDYWQIRMSNTISAPSTAAIFANPTLFAQDFIRSSNGTLEYVYDANQNLGNTITSGYDLNVLARLQTKGWGDFAFKLDGTYTNRYLFQQAPGGAYCNNVGVFGCGGGLSIAPVNSIPVMTFKWKDVATLTWSRGDWVATVQDQFQTHYLDLNQVKAPYNDHVIPSYSLVNTSVTYTGFRNTTIIVGINNLFNRMPPPTNSVSNGYLSNYANPTGTAYALTASYKW